MAIFTFVNVVLCVVAIGSGATVLRGLLRGTLTDRWAVYFLQSSLIASVAELLSPAHHLHAIQESCMLSVYVSAVAVLAWLDFGLTGAWRSIFAFSITLVLYLNVAVLFLQFDQYLHLLDALSRSSSDAIVRVVQAVVVVAFAVLGILAAKGFGASKSHPSGTLHSRPR